MPFTMSQTSLAESLGITVREDEGIHDREKIATLKISTLAEVSANILSNNC